MKKSAVFIGKGGRDIGMGHLYRLMTLRNSFRRKYNVTFLLNNDPLAVAFARAKGIFYATYVSYDCISEHMRRTGGADIVITDMLYTPARLLRQLKGHCRSVIVIDDMRRWDGRRCDATIVCSQETFRRRFSRCDARRRFEGTDYFPLPSEFLRYRKQKEFRQDVRNILVCLGGATAVEHMAAVVKTLDRCLDRKVRINVVVGYRRDRFPVSCSERVRLYGWVSDMAAMITHADVGVIAGGLSKFEYMCIGTPFCMVALNAHQEELAKKYAAKGYGMYLGHIRAVARGSHVLREKIHGIITAPRLREMMYVRSRALVDGRGGERILALAE